MTDLSSPSADEPWHVAPHQLERYVRGGTPPSQAASIEPHLTTCGECRSSLAVLMQSPEHLVSDRLRVVLDEIIESVDAPAPSAPERLLERIGVPEHVTRLFAVSRELQLSWLVAVAALLSLTVLASRAGDADTSIFLVVAPLLPLAVVAAAFRIGGGTLAELTATTPTRTSWLLLIRSISVVAPTFVLCGVAAIAVPGQGWESAAWLLPALALSSMAAALSTWVQPITAAVGLTAAWFVALTATSGPIVRSLRAVSASRLADGALFEPSGQLVALALTLISLLVLLSRRDVLDVGSPA